ncbi:MAG TPA: MmgE/PrpD family protein [Candidatus Acidoferrales bacterium]|nr:MmgE/PrpD family protein [Candidatus Acidoferrales bacterium]
MTTLTASPARQLITRRLAEYAVNLGFGDLPAATVEKTKQAVLDLLGIAIRASIAGESSDVVRQVVDSLGSSGKATGIGIGPRYRPHYAALLNGTFAHTLDFDDTHEGGSIHPGAPLIPAVLAVAEEMRAPGANVIAAIVAGYDATVRIAEAADPAAHYDRGFHPTATCGTFGATAALANVTKAGADVLENAFGINGSQSAGSLQFLENGAWNKRIHTGLTAHNAILALRFAQAGAIGARDALEGRSGFFRGYTDGADPEHVVRTLGERFAIDETAFKPYPSCRYSHAAIDVIREIVAEGKVKPDGVSAIRIGLPRKGMDLIGVPEEAKRTPHSIVDGQFSMFFLAAVALLHGRMTWDDYKLLGTSDIARTIERIQVRLDPEIEARFPTMAASVEIDANGTTIRRINWTPKGEPDKPLSWDEVEAKFVSLARAVYEDTHCARIVEMVRSLDQLDEIGELMTLLGQGTR